MATKKPMKKPVKRVRRFQEGGEAADKAAGLAASNMDAPMGFFERLRMGNIDQEGSQAYNRLGAGRAKMDRDAANELAASRMVDASRMGDTARSARGSYVPEQLDAEAGETARMSEMMDRGRRAGMEVDGAERMRDYKPLAAAQNAQILAAKPAKPKPAAAKPAAAKPSAAPAAAAAAPRNDASAIPGASAAQAASAASPDGERVSGNEISRRLENTLLATGAGGVGLLGLAAKLKKAYQASKAPGTGFILKGGRFVKDPNAPTKRPRKALPSPVTDVVAKKKGGAVKKMASGGSIKSSVSTASKRGDGIAQRGKTRGKMY